MRVFDRIKEVLGAKKHSRKEQADAYKLTDMPFTKALLSRASQYQDEAVQDLQKMLGRTKPISQDKTFNEFAASCAVTVAHITTEAMKSIGHDAAAFQPYEPVPAYAPMIVTYTFLY